MPKIEVEIIFLLFSTLIWILGDRHTTILAFASIILILIAVLFVQFLALLVPLFFFSGGLTTDNGLSNLMDTLCLAIIFCSR